jgi:hypothetical protein
VTVGGGKGRIIGNKSFALGGFVKCFLFPVLTNEPFIILASGNSFKSAKHNWRPAAL